MKLKNINLLHLKVFDYEAPSFKVVDISSEGVLCSSERDIENFELLDEMDW